MCTQTTKINQLFEGMIENEILITKLKNLKPNEIDENIKLCDIAEYIEECESTDALELLYHAAPNIFSQIDLSGKLLFDYLNDSPRFWDFDSDSHKVLEFTRKNTPTICPSCYKNLADSTQNLEVYFPEIEAYSRETYTDVTIDFNELFETCDNRHEAIVKIQEYLNENYLCEFNDYFSMAKGNTTCPFCENEILIKFFDSGINEDISEYKDRFDLEGESELDIDDLPSGEIDIAEIHLISFPEKFRRTLSLDSTNMENRQVLFEYIFNEVESNCNFNTPEICFFSESDN